ncbi:MULTISPECIES: SusC/RagA family TonB-linked outer membrane protein [Sphingobacterium]|nr:SusC/RagA family TonB-linked outer membrane protein [Sphingobacterium multivorum]
MFMRLLCILSVWMCWLTSYSQVKERNIVRGVIVSSEDLRPLQGVTVQNMVTNMRLKSEADGSFGIRGDLRDTLRFSAMGYQELRVLVKDVLAKGRVLMAVKDNYLEEVQINTGYQILKPNETTGSASVISNDMLNQQTGTNILNRLNNVASGLRFENQPSTVSDRQKLNFSVRGLSTIDGNLDPLIVLDGFIYEGNVANIDPNSIESVTVLKDAAASSIWGARAGNGVVVITSKKGGQGAGKIMNTTFSSTLITKAKPNLDQVYQLSNKDFIDAESMLFNKGFYDWLANGFQYISVTPAIDIFDRTKRGLLTPADSADLINELMTKDGRKSYRDLFLESPFSQQYSLNLSGGSRQYNYGFSGGYTREIDEYAGRFRKLNLQLTNSFQPTEKLDIAINLLFTNSISEPGKPKFESLHYNGKQVPYMDFYNNDGSQRAFYPEFRGTYMTENYGTPYLDWGYYPLTDYKQAVSTTRLNEWYSTISGKYKILPFLDVSVGFQYQIQQTDLQGLYNEESYYARKNINQFMEVSNGGSSITYHIPRGGIKSKDFSSGRSYTARTQLNMNKSWGLHRLIGMAGGEIRETAGKGENYWVYGYKEKPLQAVPVDFTTYFTIAPSMVPMGITGSPSFTDRVNRFVSLYSNWSYIFKDRYAWSGSFRKDGGNIFGAKTNDKWSPLWSTGLSWDIGKESFIALKDVDRLKLRATYGYSGNVDLRKTPQPIASVTAGTYTRLPALTVSKLNDPSLRWEKVSTFNLGLDLSLFKGRLSGTVDHYIKTGKDLYGLTDFDYTAWGKSNTVTKNVASMRGKGWDITLSTNNLDKAVKWNSRLILNLNKNRTTAYYRALNGGVSSFLGDGNTITPIPGMPLNALSAFKWMGLDSEGNPQGILRGEVSKDYIGINNAAFNDGLEGGSIVFYGSAKPQVYGSLINTFGWKSWTLSLNVSYKGDYYFRKPATSYYNLFNRGTAFPDFEMRWQQAGDELKTSVPSVQYPLEDFRDALYVQSEVNVLKADHLRLEYINISWDKTLRLQQRDLRMKFYGNVSNLGLLWTANKQNIDPEFPYRISPPTTLSFGCQLNY